MKSHCIERGATIHVVWDPAGHHHHREPYAQHVGGGHAWEREGGGLLVHRVDPGPGSMCSSPEKPSRTRAGGRGGRRGNPALP